MSSATAKTIGGRTAVKVCTLLLVVVQTMTVWYLIGSLLFPLAITIGVGWVLFGGGKFEIPEASRFRVLAAMAIFFVIKSRVAPVPVRGGSVTSMTQFAHVAGQFCMVLQFVFLAGSAHKKVLPQVIPWLGTAMMICAGDLYVDDVQRSVFQLLVLAFIIFAAAFSALNREMYGREAATVRTPVLGVLLVAVGAIGWYSSVSLHDHSRDLETLLSNLVDPRAVPQESGFSTQGRLRSVVRFRDRNADAIAMRVYSNSAPGYLRGFVFGEYSRNSREWLPHKTVDRTVQPSALGDIPRDAGENAFYLTLSRDLKLGSPMQLWPIGDLEDTIFLPANAACATASVDSLEVTGEGNLTAPHLPIGYPYTIHSTVDPVQATLSTSAIKRYRYDDLKAVPPQATKLATTLMDPAAEFDQNTAAVSNYFQQNYKYSTTHETPVGHDPIEWFLSEGKVGHCEYFATATALILRAGGIPTRYVTGFVTDERNTYGDYWVVRNKCAHAWVEAWDKDRGRWVIVESTPAAGVPSNPNTSQFAQLWNFVKDRYQVFRVRLHQRGPIWAIAAVLSSWLFRALLGLTLIWLFIRLRRWNRKRHSGSKRSARRDANARAFQHVLSKVDRRLKREYGLSRSAHETLHQFSSRVVRTVPDAAAISSWYQAYAAARYSPNSATSLTELQRSAKKL
jgi:transglutaminase-like putative cysteine protease